MFFNLFKKNKSKQTDSDKSKKPTPGISLGDMETNLINEYKAYLASEESLDCQVYNFPEGSKLQKRLEKNNQELMVLGYKIPSFCDINFYKKYYGQGVAIRDYARVIARAIVLTSLAAYAADKKLISFWQIYEDFPGVKDEGIINDAIFLSVSQEKPEIYEAMHKSYIWSYAAANYLLHMMNITEDLEPFNKVVNGGVDMSDINRGLNMAIQNTQEMVKIMISKDVDGPEPIDALELLGDLDLALKAAWNHRQESNTGKEYITNPYIEAEIFNRLKIIRWVMHPNLEWDHGFLVST